MAESPVIAIMPARNGYVLRLGEKMEETEICATLDELFVRLLTHFEWRHPGGDGKNWGDVKIFRDHEHEGVLPFEYGENVPRG